MMQHSNLLDSLNTAVKAIQTGGIVAYPTEAVYGLGCDPHNEAAVKNIVRIKQRELSQGVILIGSDWSQLAPFAAEVPNDAMQKALATWPGPYTWLFPAHPDTPSWLTGDHDTIALRVTNHETAGKLCALANTALVSTSANRHGEPPARCVNDVREQFADCLDTIACIIDAPLGESQNPTTIGDVITGQILRRG